MEAPCGSPPLYPVPAPEQITVGGEGACLALCEPKLLGVLPLCPVVEIQQIERLIRRSEDRITQLVE